MNTAMREIPAWRQFTSSVITALSILAVSALVALPVASDSSPADAAAQQVEKTARADAQKFIAATARSTHPASKP